MPNGLELYQRNFNSPSIMSMMNCALAVLSNLTALEQSRGLILVGLSRLYQMYS